MFRTASTNSTPATGLVITTPSGAASGDVLIAYLLSDGAGNDITAPDGTWTSRGSFNDTDISFKAFTKVLSAAPAGSYTFDNDQDSMVGGLIAIDTEGGTSVTILASSVGEGLPDNELATPNITNPADPKVFVGIWGTDTNFTVSAPPSGMTSAHSLLSPSTYSLAAYYQNNPSDVGNISRTLIFSGSDTMVSLGIAVSWTAGGGASGRDLMMLGMGT